MQGSCFDYVFKLLFFHKQLENMFYFEFDTLATPLVNDPPPPSTFLRATTTVGAEKMDSRV